MYKLVFKFSTRQQVWQRHNYFRKKKYRLQQKSGGRVRSQETSSYLGRSCLLAGSLAYRCSQWGKCFQAVKCASGQDMVNRCSDLLVFPLVCRYQVDTLVGWKAQRQFSLPVVAVMFSYLRDRAPFTEGLRRICVQLQSVCNNIWTVLEEPVPSPAQAGSHTYYRLCFLLASLELDQEDMQ